MTNTTKGDIRAGDMGMLDIIESTVLDMLADVWDEYLRLPELHPQDKVEFMQAIHAAQNIVMARPVQRQQAEAARNSPPRELIPGESFVEIETGD